MMLDTIAHQSDAMQLVKSHRESIFSKTGASGQMALRILMRSLSPPLRRN